MTAVDFLFEQIYIKPKDKAKWDAILIIAKEMEKQQIVDAFHSGTKMRYFKTAEVLDIATLPKGVETGEDYYNQTFKAK